MTRYPPRFSGLWTRCRAPGCTARSPATFTVPARLSGLVRRQCTTCLFTWEESAPAPVPLPATSGPATERIRE
jgi:hypothetical protein